MPSIKKIKMDPLSLPVDIKIQRRKITDLTRDDFIQWISEHGEKPFRANQIFQWVYLHKIKEWDEMQNVSKKIRQKLANEFSLETIPIIEKTVAPDGTIKFLQELKDGHKIESVLLKQEDRYTVCISTQVGCAMACKFCLTATMGFKRNLTPGEIVDQVLNAHSLMPQEKQLRNIVYMGMGEPFNNYDNTIQSLKIFLDSHGFAFSSRRITVSTSGVIPGIIKFGQEKDIKVNLAISLNGVTQETRKQLMPISKKHSLPELLKACADFPLGKRQRITFEYILIKDVTDSIDTAKKLVKILHGVKSKVNLIPYNENPDLEFKSPSKEQIKRFHQYLLDHGIIATMRVSRGQGISAACGQLAVKNKTDTLTLLTKHPSL